MRSSRTTESGLRTLFRAAFLALAPLAAPSPSPAEEPPPADPERKLDLIYMTFMDGAPYQVRRIYAPRRAPVDQLPETAKTLEAAGYGKDREAPKEVALIESDSEMRIETFGRSSATIGGMKQWVDLQSGNVLAFDFAMTSGGSAQRIKGFLSKDGVRVLVMAGNEERESHTIPVPKDAFIPSDMDFIHRYFQGLIPLRADPKVPDKAERGCTFNVFVPDAISSVTLSARPAEEEAVALEGANVRCMKYEVWTAVASGARARQFMWFSLKDGRLSRREDYDETGAKVSQITERVSEEKARQLTALVVGPPKFDPRPFEAPLGKAVRYRVYTRDKEIGWISYRFDRETDPAFPANGYVSNAEAEMSPGGTKRSERAVTRFDSRLLPLSYKVEGRETIEHDSDYGIEVALRENKARVRETRKYRPPDPKDPNAQKPPADPPPREMEFPMDEGVFLSDFHRIDHLVAILSQVPWVHGSAGKFGAYLVRRNLPVIVPYTIRDLRLPGPMGEKPAPQKDGAVWEIALSGVGIPGAVRLDGKGQLLSFVSRSGGVDITYLIEDLAAAIQTTGRKPREKAEGPTLLRAKDW